MAVESLPFDTLDRASSAHGKGGGIVPVTRRGMLGMLSRGGLVMVGSLAALAATSGTVHADGEVCRQVACCNLKKCDDCAQEGCDFFCPSGWTKRSWGCVAGTRPILCGECQDGGTNCHNGNSYICSIVIDHNAC